MNWILARVLHQALNEELAVPEEIGEAHEAFLEDAGIALSELASLELLDALGENADSYAAKALALLN